MQSIERFSIVVRGGYGLGNFGDDALMVAAYQVASKVFQPGEIGFLCHDDSYFDKLLPEARCIRRDSEKRIRTDYFVYGGGTQFDSFPRSRTRRFRDLKKALQSFSGAREFAGKVYNRLRLGKHDMETDPGARLAAIGIGVGPFVDGSWEEKAARALFHKMELVAVRDTSSFDTCRNWGARNLVQRSDLCFLPGLWGADDPPPPSSRPDVRIGKVGIVVRDWSHNVEGNAYYEALRDVADKLRNTGIEATFICFDTRSDTNWLEWLAENREPVVAWDPARESGSDFLTALSRYDAFITARYHGAVFAAILGKPSICIGIEPKLDMVSRLLKGGGRLWSSPFSSQDCLTMFRDLESRYSRAVDDLAEVVAEQRSLAAQMVDEFCSFCSRP